MKQGKAPAGTTTSWDALLPGLYNSDGLFSAQQLQAHRPWLQGRYSAGCSASGSPFLSTSNFGKVSHCAQGTLIFQHPGEKKITSGSFQLLKFLSF